MAGFTIHKALKSWEGEGRRGVKGGKSQVLLKKFLIYKPQWIKVSALMMCVSAFVSQFE